MPKEESLKNLRRLQKGETANPNGRPKGRSLKTILKQIMDANMPVKQNPITKEYIESGHLTVKEMFILSQIAQAMKGNSPISKEIWERLEGKIVQPIETAEVAKKIDLSKLTDDELRQMREIEKKIQDV